MADLCQLTSLRVYFLPDDVKEVCESLLEFSVNNGKEKLKRERKLDGHRKMNYLSSTENFSVLVKPNASFFRPKAFDLTPNGWLLQCPPMWFYRCISSSSCIDNDLQKRNDTDHRKQQFLHEIKL